MWRASLAAALVALTAGALAAQNGPAKGPAPKLMIAQADDQGRLFLLQEVVAIVQVQEKIVVQVNNQPQEQTVTRSVPVQRLERVPLDMSKARIHDATGKAVEPKELRKRLKAPTAVLVSNDGRPVDPFYLRLARPDTVVVVSPEFASSMTPRWPAPPPQPKILDLKKN